MIIDRVPITVTDGVTWVARVHFATENDDIFSSDRRPQFERRVVSGDDDVITSGNGGVGRLNSWAAATTPKPPEWWRRRHRWRRRLDRDRQRKSVHRRRIYIHDIGNALCSASGEILQRRRQRECWPTGHCQGQVSRWKQLTEFKNS